MIYNRKPEIVQLLPSGHKIGKPAPLFTKIETAHVEELKAKYGGKQQSDDSPKQSVAELEAAIAKQVHHIIQTHYNFNFKLK